MAKEKQKGTVADKGKKKLTTAGKGKENSCPVVQVLRERNTGVVIRDEHDIMRLREDKRKAEAMAMEKKKGTVADKGKKKITTAGNGKENLCPTVPNNNVPSKRALAQRARRDRERNERLMSASPRERGQQLRREREQFIQPLEPVYFPPLTPCRRPYSCLEQQTNQTNVNPLASKRQLVTHTSICPTSVPSTSYAPQRPTPTSELLQDDACANDDVEGVPPRVTQPFICSTSIPSTSYAPQRPTPTSELFQEDACSEDGMEGFSSRVNAQCPISPCRHFLGKMNVLCPDCKAWHWMDEKLTRSSKKNPLFGTCCLQGKVRLPLLITPPPPLQALYDGNDDQSKSFRTHTREYNAANAFTSLGATLDTRVLSGRGPTSFTIHGELRHRTGSLLPVPGQHASYAQLYIYDPNSAVEVRTHRNPHLSFKSVSLNGAKFACPPSLQLIKGSAKV